MRRTTKVIFSILSITIALAAFLALAFFLPLPLGEPIIDLDFAKNPPWHLNPGKSFQVQFSIANEAWLLAATKDMKVAVTTPEGLTVSSANTNNYEIIIGTLRGGETRNYAFNITASVSSSPGTYTLTIRTYGQNVAEKTLSPNVVIELPRLL